MSSASSAIELIEKKDDDKTDVTNSMDMEISKQIHRDISWSQIIGGSIGNILEWYDFSTFGYVI